MHFTKYISIIICFFFIIGNGILTPLSLSKNNDEPINNKGFSTGISWKSVIPLKKATFVNFDENSFLDDYAYLAAVPTTIFYDQDGNRLFSNPLLFYQDAFPVKEDKERSLNARQGLDYFMDDWMIYSNGQLDQMTLINIPQSKINSSWDARNYSVVEGDNPYSIANQIALNEWSYSDNAVVAVIQEQFEKSNNRSEFLINGQVPANILGHQQFDVEEPVIGTGGTYKSFDINEDYYKYVIAKLSWPGTSDYDLQLYDPKLGMVDSSAHYYADYSTPGLFEITGSYIHNEGSWQVSVTAVPVKNTYSIIDSTFNKTTRMSIKEMVSILKNTGNVDVWLYPGTSLNIAKAPFGCRDVNFMLTWNNPQIQLGLTLLDPVGTEICSSLSKEELTSGTVVNENGEVQMHVDRLGECREQDNYSISVFSLSNLIQPVDFTLKYSWHQNYSKIEGECFTSASNGAILASTLNAPLFYVSPSNISDETTNVLNKLGVKNIFLINIGSHLSNKVKTELKKIATIQEYNEYRDLYKTINEKTGNKDTIVFTTIDPWTYWYVGEDKPAGEYPGALFIGPASYIAAQHGSPVLIVDVHPQLSQATVWPTDFWIKTVENRDEPSSGSMLTAGKEVYSFLEEYDLGKLEEGKSDSQIKETIITVADQYDIGTPWDRMFTGAAYPGRFCFSPIDTAYWISRNVFYPALIFVNPAMQGEAQRINGSASTAKLLFGRLRNPRGSTLVITKPSEDETFTYPILHTYTTYAYKFNEKAWNVWDFRYSTADGIIPYVTPSSDPIDDGVTDKAGAYYPDISESETVPFYAAKAGYGNVFSTNFEASVENLNRGVILWVENCHGGPINGGLIAMWDPDSPYVKEENPWRAYEPIMLYPGHLREFLRLIPYSFNILAGRSSSKFISNGLIKFHLFPEIGSTENPDVACANPQKILINGLAKKLIGVMDFWGAHGIMVYRDRLFHPLKRLKEGLPLINIYDGDGKVTISARSGSALTVKPYYGIDFDNALQNLHSCGLNTISCLPACTYLHMTWMRHGMTYQIIDPWTTSDWAGVWTQMIIKRFAMGDTIGQAYDLAIRACGPEPIVGQWWWDTTENVELFGDPSLRVFVPGTNYSTANHWQKEMPLGYNTNLSINGHMPFGVTNYPNQKTATSFWQQYLWLIEALSVVGIIVILAVWISKRSKKNH
jgi:hypothetical protein